MAEDDAAAGVDTADADADESPPPDTTADPVLAWTLASFHTTTFLVAPLLLLYAVDALGSLLQGVHTATGLGLYLALWGLTFWTNRRWLARTRLDDWSAVLPGVTWGGVTGVGFLLVLVGVVGVTVGEPVLVAALALVGTPIAALVGGLVGAGFAVLDLLIVAAGRRLGTA
ncbi:hypothetical protein [Haloplanus aerogenes]|uniref:DUF7965 domain-containing protein n=1 Tax=Haloplanus aerogenes TaxID=660522 RepID=A0A3M0CVB9_9EURY|nr:hypothetical protein [Haloplanus aerogenes]AZH23954.1 hypothetical protein DU502_00545 [Haloplanus aerogenes]RMB13282.1 hypothetical protein ATH50_2615 [Haloplanus aerogenes]